MKVKNLKPLLVVAATISLFGCGGGGGGGGNTSPVAGAPAATNTVTAVVTSALPVATPAAVVTASYTVDNLPPSTYADGSPQKAAFDALNKLRIGGGFGALQQSTLIDQAAKSHADYVIANYFTNGIPLDNILTVLPDGAITGHTESLGGIGFTGFRIADRLSAVGYVPVRSSEVIGYSVGISPNKDPDVTTCLAGQINSVFHRAAVLDTMLLDVGFGFSNNATTSNGFNTKACVIDFGRTTPVTVLPPTSVGIYPFNGQKNTPVEMVSEFPDPVPTSPIKGGPVSIHVPTGNTLFVKSFELRDANAQLVLSKVLTRNDSSYLGPNSAFIVPLGALKANSVYFVTFTGSVNTGIPITKDWSFTTQ